MMDPRRTRTCRDGRGLTSELLQWSVSQDQAWLSLAAGDGLLLALALSDESRFDVSAICRWTTAAFSARAYIESHK